MRNGHIFQQEAPVAVNLKTVVIVYFIVLHLNTGDLPVDQALPRGGLFAFHFDRYFIQIAINPEPVNGRFIADAADDRLLGLEADPVAKAVAEEFDLAGQRFILLGNFVPIGLLEVVPVAVNQPGQQLQPLLTAIDKVGVWDMFILKYLHFPEYALNTVPMPAF